MANLLPKSTGSTMKYKRIDDVVKELSQYTFPDNFGAVYKDYLDAAGLISKETLLKNFGLDNQLLSMVEEWDKKQAPLENKQMILDKINKLITLIHQKRKHLSDVTTFKDGIFELKLTNSDINCIYYEKYFLRNTCLNGEVFYNPEKCSSYFKYDNWLHDDRNLKDIFKIFNIRSLVSSDDRFSQDDMKVLNDAYVKYKSMEETD